MPNLFPQLEQLEDFFGHSVCHIVPEEGLSVFRVSSEDIELSVSINEGARSFQTTIFFGNAPLSTIVFEGLDELNLLGDKKGSLLRATFRVGDSEVKCLVRVHPRIEVEWSGIMV